MAPHSSAELFRWLVGDWSVERELTGVGRGRGTAHLQPSQRVLELHYRESLTIALDDAPSRLQAQREFYYRLQDDQIELWFAEARRAGERYVTLRPTRTADTWEADDIHRCGEDEYRHRVAWTPAADRFDTQVCIVGPHKRGTVLTRYRRLAPSPDTRAS